MNGVPAEELCSAIGQARELYGCMPAARWAISRLASFDTTETFVCEQDLVWARAAVRSVLFSLPSGC